MRIRERTLRGVMSPAEAVAIIAAVFVSFAAIAAARVFLTAWPAASLASSPAALAAALAAALCFGLLAVAAVVDGARCILPDPLVIPSLLIGSGIALTTGRSASIAAAALFVVGGWLVGRIVPLGFGDAKVAGALAALLGAGAACLAVGLGIVGCGIAAGSSVITGRRAPSSAVALGPWLVAAGAAVWLARWL